MIYARSLHLASMCSNVNKNDDDDVDDDTEGNGCALFFNQAIKQV